MSNRVESRRRANLADQRDGLLRSIEDLERERAAGDLDVAAYEDLHSTYVARTAEVIRELEVLGEAVEPDSAISGRRSFRRYLGRPRVRRFLGAGAAICMVAVVGIVAAKLAGVRLPGEGVTGGVVIPQKSEIEQDLAQASALGSDGQIDSAIQLYDAVLKTVPDQPEALTYRGWLERLAGERAASPVLVELGDAELAQAAKTAPTYADALGLYGIALLEDGGSKNVPRALAEFRAFCRANNTAAVLTAQGETMAEAFVAAHQVVPALLRPYERATSASPTKPA